MPLNEQKPGLPFSVVCIFLLLIIAIQTYLKIKITHSIIQTKTTIHVNRGNCR
jgi:hypothetical protein